MRFMMLIRTYSTYRQRMTESLRRGAKIFLMLQDTLDFHGTVEYCHMGTILKVSLEVKKQAKKPTRITFFISSLPQGMTLILTMKMEYISKGKTKTRLVIRRADVSNMLIFFWMKQPSNVRYTY